MKKCVDRLYARRQSLPRLPHTATRDHFRNRRLQSWARQVRRCVRVRVCAVVYLFRARADTSSSRGEYSESGQSAGEVVFCRRRLRALCIAACSVAKHFVARRHNTQHCRQLSVAAAAAAAVPMTTLLILHDRFRLATRTKPRLLWTRFAVMVQQEKKLFVVRRQVTADDCECVLQAAAFFGSPCLMIATSQRLTNRKNLLRDEVRWRPRA